MALTRKKKIIIGVSAVAALALIVIISVFASRKEEPEGRNQLLYAERRFVHDERGF